MATVTQVTLTCDVCGNAKDVKTWTFALDGKAYQIDLCRKDGNSLGRVAARYIAKARKVTAKPSRRQRRGKPRSQAATAGSGNGAVQQQKGIYVYGILPADIEVAGDMPGVGNHPGLLRDVHFDGLAALISEVDLPGRLESPGDLRTHREILDATAAEVPVLPLRFGTVLASEDAVVEELLTAHHDEFTAALDRLEGHAEFQVKGRYVEDAVLREVVSENEQAARLRDTIQGRDPDAARDARIELAQLTSQATTAMRAQDTGALKQAMEELCLASVVQEPTHELDAVHVAFLAAVDRERDIEQVIENLAGGWEGRIDVQLLGPMAAYHFTEIAQPDGSPGRQRSS